jgi:hypothetical protein
VPNNTAYNGGAPLLSPTPGNAPWIQNDATSSWISYAYPIPNANDITNDTYQYQTVLPSSVLATGQLTISTMTDNTALVYVNGTLISPTSLQPDSAQGFSIYTFNVTTLTALTIDVDVNNQVLPGSNPTGGRVVFTQASSVPDGGRTAMFLGAAMLGLIGLNWLRGKLISC